jgi:hypothetical protein
MGVRTEADRALDEIDAKIQECIRLFARIFSNETPGLSDLSAEYQAKMVDVFTELMRLRRKLDR